VTGSNGAQPLATVDVIVVGAGHAGLAASRCLSERSIDHLVIERGEVANTWRNERWDSLTLLTPNWQSSLPGYSYSGEDPNGFMTMPELIDFIDEYAKFVNTPLQTQTNVTSVRRDAEMYEVVTDNGTWRCRGVVLASGACNVPALPKVSEDLPDRLESVTMHDYRNPEQLRQGGVLVVGASATGVQLADEIHASGRPVTLAVGEHVRLPRTYRGKDIQWWMHHAGVLDEGIDDIDDIVRARSLPSPQLVGSRERQILDLNAMSDAGVRLVGRLMNIREGEAQFSGSLRNVAALADLKMGRLLDAIDEWAESSADAADFAPPERFERTRIDDKPTLSIDLNSGEIETVLWATGYRPDYSWLDIPVLDRKGRIIHDEGVAGEPGLYVLGLPFLRRRKSSFIHGIEDDAQYVVNHLAESLNQE
jgi:putative flavoprotein involved in K+ transport